MVKIHGLSNIVLVTFNMQVGKTRNTSKLWKS